MYLVGELNKKTNKIEYSSVCCGVSEVNALVIKWALKNKFVTNMNNIDEHRDIIVRTSDNPSVGLLYYRGDDALNHRYGSFIKIDTPNVDSITPALYALNMKIQNVFPLQIDIQIGDAKHTIGYATSSAVANEIIDKMNLPDCLPDAKVVWGRNHSYTPTDRTLLIATCDMLKSMLQGESGIMM